MGVAAGVDRALIGLALRMTQKIGVRVEHVLEEEDAPGHRPALGRTHPLVADELGDPLDARIGRCDLAVDVQFSLPSDGRAARRVTVSGLHWAAP